MISADGMSDFGGRINPLSKIDHYLNDKLVAYPSTEVPFVSQTNGFYRNVNKVQCACHLVCPPLLNSYTLQTYQLFWHIPPT